MSWKKVANFCINRNDVLSFLFVLHFKHRGGTGGNVDVAVTDSQVDKGESSKVENVLSGWMWGSFVFFATFTKNADVI